MANKNKRPQAPKPVRSRSIETRDFLLQHRGSRIESGKAYSRKDKHKGRGYDE